MGDQQGVQPQMQQPVVVYPNAYTNQYQGPSFSQPTSSSSGSSDSFGTVVTVLAVIFVLSALACILERLCNGGAKKNHGKHQNDYEKGSFNKSREIRPVEREPRERGEFEFGFDVKQPEPFQKPSGRDGEDIEFGFDDNGEFGGGRGGPPPPRIRHGVRFKLPENEDHHARGEIRHGGPDFEFRQGH